MGVVGEKVGLSETIKAAVRCTDMRYQAHSMQPRTMLNPQLESGHLASMLLLECTETSLAFMEEPHNFLTAGSTFFYFAKLG